MNGAPFIGDSWVHIKIAEETIKSGTYQLSEYNERWPLVNFVITFLTLVTKLPVLHISQAIPFLAGLTSIPFYCVCRRLKLPKLESALSIFLLNFNPLYSYITFSGAVMKETATYYLAVTIILLISLLNGKFKAGSGWLIASLVIGLGVILGHHYAGLIILVALWAYLGYYIIYQLKGETSTPSGLIHLNILYTVVFLAYNLYNYLTLSRFIQLLNINDVTLISALILISWYSLLNERGLFSRRAPWLSYVCFAIAVLGLRDGIYLLAQPVPPMSLGEILNYLLAGSIMLIGLSVCLKPLAIRAYATPAIAMLLFAFLWGFTSFGFTLLIKSLHYFSPLLAIGGGFTLASLSAFKGDLKKKILRPSITLLLILFFIYASLVGIRLTLNGLGAYTLGEVKSAHIIKNVELKIYGDTRVSYLLPYLSDMEASGLKRVSELNRGSILMLFRKNWELGFLAGYDWIPRDKIIDIDIVKQLSLVYNTENAQLWLT